jgi:hypothetical protein
MVSYRRNVSDLKKIPATQLVVPNNSSQAKETAAASDDDKEKQPQPSKDHSVIKDRPKRTVKPNPKYLNLISLE